MEVIVMERGYSIPTIKKLNETLSKKLLRNWVLKKADFHKKLSTRSRAKFLIKKVCTTVDTCNCAAYGKIHNESVCKVQW